MSVLRVSVDGREIDLSREARTTFGECIEHAFIYNTSRVGMQSPRGRSGKVKVYTKEEIQEFKENGGEI